MPLIFQAYEAKFVTTVRNGGGDAYGNIAERAISDGVGNPCRSCLRDVAFGEDMLVVAARPFAHLQPYAETGPIFLCAAPCAPWAGPGVPPVLKTSPDYLVKGYSSSERIVYGTGKVVPVDDLLSYGETLLQDPAVAYFDVRSSRNNCFMTRVTR